MTTRSRLQREPATAGKPTFSFRQTPSGNWSFVFEVALRDNRDLHFDYEQRTALDRQRR